MNPLLDFSGLPRFAAFKPEYVTPAVDELLAANRTLVERLAAPVDGAAPTWDNFVAPLEDANETLHRAWGQVGHLNAVMNSPGLREVYNANLPKITQYYTELGQNQGLFGKFRQLRAAPDFARLNRAQRAIIEHELRDFRLGGAELPADKKARFLAIREKLSALSSRFSDNLLDATNAFAHYVESESGLAGIPADVVQTAREAAQQDGKPGWKFTLHAPSYLPVMQYADDRALRELMYRAYSTRAAEFGTPASREQGPAQRGAGTRLRDATAEPAVGASVIPAPCASPGSDPKGNPLPPCDAPRLRDANVRESGAAPSSAGVASVSGVTSPKGAPVPPSDGAPREAAPLTPAATQEPVAATPVIAATAARKGIFLQLGAFGSRDNANSYLAQLHAQVGWLAPALHVYPKGGLFRLHAGPYANQAEARTAADRIHQELGIKAIVLVR